MYRNGVVAQNSKKSISITSSEVWTGEYRYEGAITVENGATLDLTALPYSAIPKNIVRNAGATLIRKFLPSDLPAVKLWCDFKDDKTLTFDSNFSFSSATDKSGNGNHYTNLNGLPRSPLFRNGRLESDSVSHSQGKSLRTSLSFSTDASWFYLFTGGYTSGGVQRRIFDGTVGNTLFGFHANSMGGLYIDNNPSIFVRFTKDTLPHVFSARQQSGTLLIVQDWDAVRRQTINGGVYGRSMAINDGAFGATEFSTHFAIFDVVQGSGVITDKELSHLQGYMAWSAGLQGQLDARHPYKTVPPLATISDSGVVYNGAHWARAYVPAGSRVSSSNSSGFPAAASVLGASLAWAASSNTNPNDYLQMDLGSISTVIGISLQGRRDSTQYVLTYTVRVSTDGVVFTQHEGTQTGVTDSNRFEEFLAFFTNSVQARYVRIYPVTFASFKSLRCDVLIGV